MDNSAETTTSEAPVPTAPPASPPATSPNGFPYVEAISFGFDSTKKNIKFLLLLILVLIIVNIVTNIFVTSTSKIPGLGVGVMLLSVVVSIIIQVGVMYIAIKLADGKTPKIEDLYSQYKKAVFYILTEIIKGIIQLMAFIPVGFVILVTTLLSVSTLVKVFILGKNEHFNPLGIIIIGLIALLLAIPAIIVSLKLQFASYFVVDKNYNPIDAIKASWKITKGYPLQLFLFGLLLGLVVLAGLLAFVVGLLITIPTALIAQAYVYRKLTSQASGI